jgi:carbonic anhydrase
MTSRLLSAALIAGACALAVSATAEAPQQHASASRTQAAAQGATTAAAAAAAASATVKPHQGHWTYAGPTGAEHWAELTTDFKSCASAQQSPINLTGAVGAQAGPLLASWKPMPLTLKDTGHGLQVDAGRGSSVRLGDHSYNMLQFHIHTPSEHTLDGQAFPMEIHFVHKDGHGDLAVVGVLVREGAANPAVQAVVDQLGPYKRAASAATIDPSKLLPSTRSSFRYHGSLTTPPCSEIVEWVVMDTPIQASREQIAALTKAYPNNARPVQALNRRILLRAAR